MSRRSLQRKHTASVKSSSLLSHSVLRNLLGVQSITSLESNLCTAMNRYTRTGNFVSHNKVNLLSQNMTEPQSSVFLTGIHRLRDINI
jgi:hypothetical protein